MVCFSFIHAQRRMVGDASFRRNFVEPRVMQSGNQGAAPRETRSRRSVVLFFAVVVPTAQSRDEALAANCG
jgi:hypothetical protein